MKTIKVLNFKGKVRIALVLSLLFLALVSLSFAKSSTEIVVPVGKSPTVDGKKSPGEWDDARCINIKIDSVSMTKCFKHDGKNLYVLEEVSGLTSSKGILNWIVFDVDKDNKFFERGDFGVDTKRGGFKYTGRFKFKYNRPTKCKFASSFSKRTFTSEFKIPLEKTGLGSGEKIAFKNGLDNEITGKWLKSETIKLRLASQWIYQRILVRYNNEVQYSVLLKTQGNKIGSGVEIDSVTPFLSTARGPDAREAAKIVSAFLSNCGFGNTKYGQKIIDTLDRFIRGNDISWKKSGDSIYRVTPFGFGPLRIFREEIYIKKLASTNKLPEDIIQILAHESVHAACGPRSLGYAQEEVQAHWARGLGIGIYEENIFPGRF